MRKNKKKSIGIFRWISVPGQATVALVPDGYDENVHDVSKYVAIVIKRADGKYEWVATNGTDKFGVCDDQQSAKGAALAAAMPKICSETA